jgi:ribonuclease P protein component
MLYFSEEILNRFPKSERLNRKKVIDGLFAEKQSSSLAHPVRMVWTITPLDSPVQVLFSVPKRNFKKAHDRNRIKRQMREAYRLNKELLTETCSRRGISLALAILFVGKELPEWETLRDKIIVLLNRLNTTLDSDPQPSQP